MFLERGNLLAANFMLELTQHLMRSLVVTRQRSLAPFHEGTNQVSLVNTTMRYSKLQKAALLDLAQYHTLIVFFQFHLNGIDIFKHTVGKMDQRL